MIRMRSRSWTCSSRPNRRRRGNEVLHLRYGPRLVRLDGPYVRLLTRQEHEFAAGDRPGFGGTYSKHHEGLSGCLQGEPSVGASLETKSDRSTNETATKSHCGGRVFHGKALFSQPRPNLILQFIP